MPLEVALGKANFRDTHTMALVSWNIRREQKEIAHSDPFVLGKGKWISSRLREISIFFNNFCQPQILYPLVVFPFFYIKTHPKQVSAVAMQIRAEDCDEARLDAWGPDMERKGWSIKKSLGNCASHKFKEGSHKCSSLIHAPSFLVSPTHLSGWARPNSNPRREVLRKQGHEARVERAICTLYFQTEKIHRGQGLRSQIIAEGMPACQVFL